MNELNILTKKYLLSLPARAWQDTTPRYESVLILPTMKKHDSGYGCIAIIGVIGQQPIHIAAQCCDDVEWKLPDVIKTSSYSIGNVRMDCLLKSGAMRFWTNSDGVFKVSEALSSVTIEFVKQ